MPTYKYRREDGTTFTIRQKITADPLEEDPDTGQKVERVITGGMGFHLKGSGWYSDGYSSSADASSKGETSSSDEASNGAENGPSENSASEAGSKAEKSSASAAESD